ncbi:Uncharacterized protein HZ326_12778 [Fusarium oxysporum f. sp. albedinis]|nr:Uncharacterized protein HZ326_12778 [Fusarium oxysporum f. sp. albedinis]
MVATIAMSLVVGGQVRIDQHMWRSSVVFPRYGWIPSPASAVRSGDRIHDFDSEICFFTETTLYTLLKLTK